MPFYRKYFGCVPQLGAYLDKTMVEYRTASGARVMIHYLIQEEGADGQKHASEESTDGQEYSHEEMRDMFGGICVSEFILFSGSSLGIILRRNRRTGSSLW